MSSLSAEERFWKRVAMGGEEECWEYLGARLPSGYGKITKRLGNSYAHRFAYEYHHGPIPDGLHVRHSCDNPPCVNPAHLSVGTVADNMADRDASGHTARGERVRMSNLTEADIRFIRENYSRYGKNGLSAAALSRRLGVSASTVLGIVSRRYWSHVA